MKVVQRIPVRIAVERKPDDPALRAGMSTVVTVDTGIGAPSPIFGPCSGHDQAADRSEMDRKRSRRAENSATMNASTNAPAEFKVPPHRGVIVICNDFRDVDADAGFDHRERALPYMQGTFSSTLDQVTWVLTSYIVASAVMTAPVGWLAARFGRKRVFVICLGGFTLSSVMCGFAYSLEQMVFYRVVQGATGGGNRSAFAVRHDGSLSHERARQGDGDVGHGRDGGSDHRADNRRLSHPIRSTGATVSSSICRLASQR